MFMKLVHMQRLHRMNNFENITYLRVWKNRNTGKARNCFHQLRHGVTYILRFHSTDKLVHYMECA